MNISQSHHMSATKKQLLDQLNFITNRLTTEQVKTLIMEASTLLSSQSTCRPKSAPLQTLSAREVEVLVLVASGYNRRNIGVSLGITANTAARHIANIYTKLGIGSVAEATSFAYDNRLIASSRHPTAIAGNDIEPATAGA